MVRKLESAWNTFWFSPRPQKPIALFRRVAATIMLVYYMIRHIDLPLFYYDSGILPLEASKHLFEGRYHSVLFWFPSSNMGVQALHLLFLAVLALLALGIYPRAMAVIALYLHVLFEQRDYLVAYGFDKVAACWLFYLMFMRSDSHYTILKSKRREGLTDFVTSAAFRMAQIQLCLIYAHSGLDKLRGVSWWNGEALWAILSNGIMSPIDFGFMAYVPWLIYVATYASLIWEIYFPFAVMNSRTRKTWLIFGIAFHALTALAMNLVFFALIMTAGYILFWDFTDLNQETRAKRRS